VVPRTLEQQSLQEAHLRQVGSGTAVALQPHVQLVVPRTPLELQPEGAHHNKFGAQFDRVAKGAGMKVLRTAIQAPLISELTGVTESRGAVASDGSGIEHFEVVCGSLRPSIVSVINRRDK